MCPPSPGDAGTHTRALTHGHAEKARPPLLSIFEAGADEPCISHPINISGRHVCVRAAFIAGISGRAARPRPRRPLELPLKNC